VSDAPARRPVTLTRVVVIDGDTVRERPDRLVTEEPMEIRVQGPGQQPEALAVTMRTPGHDFELAVGFCVTEGVLTSPDELESAAYCLGGQGEQLYNVVTVKLRRRCPRVSGGAIRHQLELRIVRRGEPRDGWSVSASRWPTAR